MSVTLGELNAEAEALFDLTIPVASSGMRNKLRRRRQLKRRNAAQDAIHRVSIGVRAGELTTEEQAVQFALAGVPIWWWILKPLITAVAKWAFNRMTRRVTPSPSGSS